MQGVQTVEKDFVEWFWLGNIQLKRGLEEWTPASTNERSITWRKNENQQNLAMLGSAQRENGNMISLAKLRPKDGVI